MSFPVQELSHNGDQDTNRGGNFFAGPSSSKLLDQGIALIARDKEGDGLEIVDSEQAAWGSFQDPPDPRLVQGSVGEADVHNA